jgi:hypothetical protein
VIQSDTTSVSGSIVLDVLLDPAVAATLTAILGALVGYLLSLRKWTLEKRHLARQLEAEHERQNRLRFLNDLGKDYTSLMLAINELAIQSKAIEPDQALVDGQRKEATRALLSIANTAPASVQERAYAVWKLATAAFDERASSSADAYDSLMRANLVDFQRLAGRHLRGEESPALAPGESQGERARVALEAFLSLKWADESSADGLDRHS